MKKNMKKIIVLCATIVLIIGVLIVKANTNIFKTVKQNIGKTQKHLKTPIPSYKKSTNSVDAEDDDGYTNYISVDNVLLYGSDGFGNSNGIMKIADVNPTTARAVYGNPQSEITEFSDVYNANVLVYKYPAAELSFLDDKLLSVDILDEGFSFELRTQAGNSLLLTSGSELRNFYNVFTSSVENGSYNGVHLYIKSHTGAITDAVITLNLMYDINETDIGNQTIRTLTLQN